MKKSLNLNLKHFPKELRLILEIMKVENDNSLIFKRKEMFSDINWEKFIELAIYHRVYPLIYPKLKKMNIEWIPKQVCQSLLWEYQRNTFKMLLLSGEMEQISKLLSENNLRLLFLKGPAIAVDLYGDISLRTSKDLDILIHLVDLEKVDTLLLDLGYQREVGIIENFDKKKTQHDIPYYHPEKQIQVELHWRMYSFLMNEADFNGLWDRRQKSNLTSYPVYYFGVEDLFLYLIAHGSKHGYSRLRWLADIDQCIRTKMDGKDTINLIKSYAKDHMGRRSDLFIGQTLILANQLLDTPIDKMMNVFKIKGRSSKLAQMNITYINKMFLDSSSFKDNKLKFGNNKLNLVLSNLVHSFLFQRNQLVIRTNTSKKLYILSMLSPPAIDRKILALPKFLHFLYFPLRPFLWAWRKTRNPH